MEPDHLARIVDDPRYRALLRRRGRLTWALTVAMLAVYFGFVATIAFDKAALARPIGSGVTSLGIPIGLGVIVVAIVLTWLYVRQAAREYDGLMQALVAEYRA